jgi:hypothetical protein
LRQNQIERQLRQQAHNLQLLVTAKEFPNLNGGNIFITWQVNGFRHWTPPEKDRYMSFWIQS